MILYPNISHALSVATYINWLLHKYNFSTTTTIACFHLTSSSIYILGISEANNVCYCVLKFLKYACDFTDTSLLLIN